MLTLCPLGYPNKAIGPESQIEPWMTRSQTVSGFACSRFRHHRQDSSPHLSLLVGNGEFGNFHTSRTAGRPFPRPSNLQIITRDTPTPSNTRDRILQTVRGWLPKERNFLASSSWGKFFLLTSPFIEPEGPEFETCLRSHFTAIEPNPSFGLHATFVVCRKWPELALLPLSGKRAWRADRANDSPEEGVSHVLQVRVHFWLTATRGLFSLSWS